jgi:hypothetical protein
MAFAMTGYRLLWSEGRSTIHSSSIPAAIAIAAPADQPIPHSPEALAGSPLRLHDLTVLQSPDQEPQFTIHGKACPACLLLWLQIGSDGASRVADLTSWIGILGDAPKALLSALGVSRKAADLIAPEGELPKAKAFALPT